MKTIAVFFGGKSNEREISVITGTFAYNLLRGAGYYVLPVYIAEDGTMYTSEKMKRVEFFRDFVPDPKTAVALDFGRLVEKRKPKRTVAKIDCALNCCHGGMGEDGTLSALLRYFKIKSASPDTAVSAVFMDKSLTKAVVRGLGIPVLPSVTLTEETPDKAACVRLGFPLIVKPARLGSSIGIHVAENEEELDRALKEAFRLDKTALVERYLIHKRDVNCAAYRKGGEVVLSECEEVFSSGTILSFSEKYEGTGERKSQIPAVLPDGCAERIKAYTREIYDYFSVRGMVRADFLVSGEEVYFNELNTVPGSLACYLFGDRLVDARDLIRGLIEEALSAPEEEKETVSSGILRTAVFSGKGGKRSS